ncbi:MobV family relaxase, partial [Acinetobacter sp. YH12052]
MSFAILRIQKLKSFADVGGSLSHNYRNRETLNADDARTHLNEHELDTNEKCMTAIRDRIPEKRRKDAVLCIEHLITASPEWDGWGTEKETAFFEQSKKWLENKYGKNNVVSTTIHRDETTPHLVAYVVPVDEKTGR